MRRFLNRLDFFAFVPLAIFTGMTTYHAAEFPARWVIAFQVTLLPALLFLVVGLRRFERTGRLWLATNLWLGLLGVLTLFEAWILLEALGGTLMESGSFVMLSLIGVVSTLTARGGFIGVLHPSHALLRRCSWLLVLIAVLAALVSFVNLGDRMTSIFVPVLIFMGSEYMLRKKLARAPKRSENS